MITERMQALAGVPLNESVDSFIKEFIAGTKPNPLNPNERIAGGALIELSKMGDHIHIHSIRSYMGTGQGYGTRSMEVTCRIADKHGVVLHINAIPYGDDKMPKSKLKSWYKTFGFKPLRGDEMVREPK